MDHDEEVIGVTVPHVEHVIHFLPIRAGKSLATHMINLRNPMGINREKQFHDMNSLDSANVSTRHISYIRYISTGESLATPMIDFRIQWKSIREAIPWYEFFGFCPCLHNAHFYISYISYISCYGDRILRLYQLYAYN